MKKNNGSSEISPQVYAKIGGVAYLILILIGMFSVLFIRDQIILWGDPTTTANNIINSKSLWNIGIFTDLMMHVSDVIVMLTIYVLLRPVNKYIALLAMLFHLIQTSVLVINKMNLIAVLFPLGTSSYLGIIETQQLHLQAYLSLRLHEYGMGVALIFFGFTCLINGYLIFRSDYLPKIIGVMLQIGGFCYLVNSSALFLWPELSAIIFPAIYAPYVLAELTLSIWLILKGVNVSKWENQATIWPIRREPTIQKASNR